MENSCTIKQDASAEVFFLHQFIISPVVQTWTQSQDPELCNDSEPGYGMSVAKR